MESTKMILSSNVYVACAACGLIMASWLCGCSGNSNDMSGESDNQAIQEVDPESIRRPKSLE